jgi:hypothetical protein
MGIEEELWTSSALIKQTETEMKDPRGETPNEPRSVTDVHDKGRVAQPPEDEQCR